MSERVVLQVGCGDGYRIAGPKFNGTGEVLLSKTLTGRDADEIRAYLDHVPADAEMEGAQP